MAFLVKKYGGTSVGTVERIQRVAEQLKKARDGREKSAIAKRHKKTCDCRKNLQ